MTIYVKLNWFPNTTSKCKFFSTHLYAEWASAKNRTFETPLTAFINLSVNRFAVHRLVMMSSSSYFKALLGPNFEEGQKDEVPIANIDGPTLKLIIDFCYTGKIKITDANIMEIVAAASVMNLVRIEQMCEQFWNDKLRVANCVEIFGCADKYSFLDLRQKSLDFICEHFVDVAPSDLQELEFEFIAEVLKCNEINALEEYIFQQMLQWVDCDGEKRSQYCADVLKMIQMEKIPLPVRSITNTAQKHSIFLRLFF